MTRWSSDVGAAVMVAGCVDDFQSKGVTALSELDPHRLCRRCGAMLDGEGEIIAVAAQIEIGIPPGVELGGAAQRLTGADAATSLLGVMDDEHGNVMPALQLAQVGEQRGDLAAGVLVDAVETYERIEDEQARLQSGDGLGEVAAVGLQIEPDGGRGDDLDVEIGQRHTGCCRDAFEASAHDVQCVLGGEQQDATGPRHGEAAQTWDAGGDRDGEVQRQERLAAPELRTEPRGSPGDR